VISSLSDSGAEVYIIKSSLLNDCNIRPIGRIKLSGVIGQPFDAKLVNLTLHLADNCSATVLFATCGEVNEDCILTTDVINKLRDLYNRMVVASVDIVDGLSVHKDAGDETTDDAYIDVDNIDSSVAQTENSTASIDLLSQEQLDETLNSCWALVKRNKGN
jgi:hypothetical protein